MIELTITKIFSILFVISFVIIGIAILVFPITMEYLHNKYLTDNIYKQKIEKDPSTLATINFVHSNLVTVILFCMTLGYYSLNIGLTGYIGLKEAGLL